MQNLKEIAIELVISNLVISGKLEIKDVADHIMLLNGCEDKALAILLLQSRKHLNNYYLDWLINSRN